MTLEDQSGLETVRSLLNHGANPNQAVHVSNGTTVWGLFLQSFYAEKILNGNLPKSCNKWFFRVVDLLLEHGADPYLSIEANPYSGSTTRYKRTVDPLEYMTASQILHSILPDEDIAKLKEKIGNKATIWRLELAWLAVKVGICSTI
ncbi:hypothetical protein MMC14_005727 [Varicellaria rhodocarpa]|nr:hypothetical protein [Varicellaria rhodocarpa]